MQKASVAYMQTQITTTNQGELLLMLYEGAIKFLTQAKTEIEKQNFAEKGMLISRAMDIIAELDGSLNMEKGGELSKNLHQLYMFCNSHLLKASIKMNVKFVDDVINILEGLRSAYAQIINTPEAIAAINEAPAQNLAEATPRTAGNRMFADTAPLQAPTGPAALGISAKAQSAAYMQQHTQTAQTPVKDAEEAPAIMRPVQQELAPQAATPVPQPETQAAAEALNALASQTTQAAPAAPTAPAQTAAAPQNTPQQQTATPPSAAAGSFGFARQMAGNAMYRKMSQA